MQRIRAYYDGDHEETLTAPTSFQTENNQHKLYCSMCGEDLYVNRIIFDDVINVIKKSLENPIICENCLGEYDELAHSR